MIITDYHQYKELCNRMNRDECVLTPIFRDPYHHRLENTILCVGITFKNYDTYIVSVSHDDAPTFDIPSGSTFSNTDIEILAYVSNVSLPRKDYDVYITNTHNQFGLFKDTNKLIPITVWGKYLKQYNAVLIQILNTHVEKLQTHSYMFVKTLFTTLRDIETSGLKVNTNLLTEHYGSKVRRNFSKDMVFSEYNVFTTTGRPSNKFGGINFSALNKSDGSRDTFISRYQDGVLVQIDFEAYHLRLIADEYNIPLPPNSLHTEFAKIYFGTNDITDELYAKSKQKTFEIMYGISDETYGIPLFDRIIEVRKQFAQTSGKQVLPSGLTVDVFDPNPSKMFNYHVQSLEVVKTLPKLQNILNLLKNTNNHLVLYTYDSILLDMKHFDGELLSQIISVLEENKKFPTRTYVGSTYGNITEVHL